VRATTSAGSVERCRRIDTFYRRHAVTVERAVARRVRAPQAVIEDACHTAWARLCEHPDVEVEAPGAVRWLVTTAIREVWRHVSRQREVGVGGWLPETDTEQELPEPAGPAPDPLAVVVAREHHRDLRERLRRLTARERQYLAMQGLGFSYAEIAAITGASIRTVERQILRGRRKLRDGG